MKLFLSALCGALLSAGLAAPAVAAGIDFHGYMRSGAGAGSKGGKEACFRLPGASAGWFRLGNECDQYAALDLGTSFGNESGTEFRGNFEIAYGTQGVTNWEQSAPAYRQLYVEAVNVGAGLNLPALEDATVWVGKRHYKNNDVHMLDYQFQETGQGPGAGIMDINVGIGRFSYALFRALRADWSASPGLDGYRPDLDALGGSQAITNHDFRLEGIQTNAGGTLQLGVNLIRKSNQDFVVKAKNGLALTAIHKQDDFLGLGGSNRVVFQQASDAANLNGTGTPGFTGQYRGWRLFDNWVAEPRRLPITLSAIAMVQEDQFGESKQRSYTLGVRPAWHFNRLFSLEGELAMQSVKPENGEARRLSKLTIAPTLAMGPGFFSRPSLRAYYTYAKWNDGARGAGNVACTGRDCATAIPAFADAKSGSTLGVQVEAWW